MLQSVYSVAQHGNKREKNTNKMPLTVQYLLFITLEKKEIQLTDCECYGAL